MLSINTDMFYLLILSGNIFIWLNYTNVSGSVLFSAQPMILQSVCQSNINTFLGIKYNTVLEANESWFEQSKRRHWESLIKIVPSCAFLYGFLLLSGVLCCHLFERLHGFHHLVGGEGLLHFAVLVHLMDALRHRDGHLLGRHPIVLPLGLRTYSREKHSVFRLRTKEKKKPIECKLKYYKCRV